MGQATGGRAEDAASGANDTVNRMTDKQGPSRQRVSRTRPQRSGSGHAGSGATTQPLRRRALIRPDAAVAPESFRFLNGRFRQGFMRQRRVPPLAGRSQRLSPFL